MATSKTKKPWLCVGSPWKTESSFWVWVRGILRKGWSKHPIKLEYIKRNRKRIKNPIEKNRARFPEVWGMSCTICGEDKVQADIEIDHIGDNCSFTGLGDTEKYVEHLYLIDYDSVRGCCKECHSIVSHAQNEGLTFEQAKTAKEIIRLMRKENKTEMLELFAKHNVNSVTITNDTKRKAALTEIFKKEL